MVHHEFKHKGDEAQHESAGIAKLDAVGGAVPGGATVDDLVAQGVEAREDQAQHLGRVLRGKCPLCH